MVRRVFHRHRNCRALLKSRRVLVKNEIALIGLALGFGSLWVADIERKTIDRINTRTGRVTARLPVGGISSGSRSASDQSGSATTPAGCPASTRKDQDISFPDNGGGPTLCNDGTISGSSGSGS
jgi:hypothetical protein